jgi:hypothetical protein
MMMGPASLGRSRLSRPGAREGVLQVVEIHDAAENERATLDRLEIAILKKASGGSLSPPILDTALSSGELRAATGTGDS